MSRISIVTFGLVLALAACDDSFEYDPNSYFAQDWEATYTKVSECSKTATHSGPYVEVWVSPDGLTAFNDGETLPEGAVVLKTQWANASCSEFDLWTVMRKGAAGTAPESGDWEWQTVFGDGEIQEQGQVAFCINCHKATCEANDLLCTSP